MGPHAQGSAVAERVLAGGRRDDESVVVETAGEGVAVGEFDNGCQSRLPGRYEVTDAPPLGVMRKG